MIARHWRGWTKPQDGDAYEALITAKVLPGLEALRGTVAGMYFGWTALWNLNLSSFDSLESIKAFAGANYSTAVFEPEAHALLSRIEPIAHHDEVRADTR